MHQTSERQQEVSESNRSCENCGRHSTRMAYIPFNGGMVVCNSCSNEWERVGAPKTIPEYHQTIASREDYRSELIAKE